VVFCSTACSTNGSSYIALANNTNLDPSTQPAVWNLVAQAGATGATGAAGSAGSQGLIGPQGPVGPASVVPGPTGPTGPTGPAGTGIGPNSFSVTTSFSNPGNESTGTNYFFNPANSYPDSNGSIGISSHTSISAATGGANFITVPAACKVVSLGLGVNNYATAVNTVTTIRLYVNGTATTMTTNVTTNGNRAASTDTTHTQNLVAGDYISVAWQDTSNLGFNNTTIQVNCQ
jgi:hypothetical protein